MTDFLKELISLFGAGVAAACCVGVSAVLSWALLWLEPQEGRT